LGYPAHETPVVWCEQLKSEHSIAELVVPMLWVTREYVHVDRVACPWLIRRFVDSEAEFLFVPKSQVDRVAKETGAIPFDAPGVELGHHDGQCSFDAIIAKYGLQDPALLYLAKIVNAADTDKLEAHPLAAGLEGWKVLPYTFSTGVGPLLGASRHAASPGSALEAYARLLDMRPELVLQAVLFAVFGVPLALFLRGDPGRRLWAGAIYLAAFFAAFVLLPPLVVGVGVDLDAFVRAYLPCVIIVLLSALLVPSEGRAEAPEG